MESEISLKDLKFEFDLSKAKFEVDVLQDRLIQFYLRSDPKFRIAYNTNYTSEFFQYLKDKARLREPTDISTMGSTRTFTKNNFIFTDKGWRTPNNMEDCKKVLSYNFDKEIYEWKKFQLISRNVDKKERFYKIIFSDNRFVELGENHPIFTLNKGWKKSSYLYPNIEIPFFRNFLEVNNQQTISISLTRIISFLLSCGHLNGSSFKFLDKRDNKYYLKKNYTINYANSSKDMVNLFCEDMKREFNMNMRYKKKRNEEYRGIEVEGSNKKIFEYLSNYIPIGKKSDIIEIPNIIFNNSKNIHKNFIATLFSGDGYITNPKKRKPLLIEYYTMSDKMANQLQLLLSQYSIISYINKKKTKSKKFINRIVITNKINILNFKKLVGKLPNFKKNKRLIEMCKLIKKQDKYIKLNRFYIKSKKRIRVKDSIIYDIFVKDNNNFFLNGILTHNSGKSESMISVAGFQMACFGKRIKIDNICSNGYEFLEKLQSIPEEQLNNTTFISDEEKQSVFNVGSTAKKFKMEDISNIIAKRNISTISINPMSWASASASYGLRSFGRDFNLKVCRFMLYDLKESKMGMPLGMIYIPIFTAFFPKEYSMPLKEQYDKKKDEWITQEMKGQDIMGNFHKRIAKSFLSDEKFNQIKKKQEKLAYLSIKLGSEYTKGEIDQIFQIIKLYENNILED